MKKLLLRPFYLLLKNDMIDRLREKHGSQFIDDVMDTFDMPTNLLQQSKSFGDHEIQASCYSTGKFN
jgi:hypothetical protein